MIPRASRIVSTIACSACLGLAGTLPAGAQSIEQLTDYRIRVAGPPSITENGSTIWTSGSLDYGTNADARHQLLKIDRTTASGAQMTTFDHGVIPLALDLTVKGLVSVSDDGAWVAFVAISDPLGTNHDRSAELFVMDSTGGQLAQLTNDPGPNAGSVTSVALAGSGNRVVFTSTSDLVPGMNPLNRENVFVVDRVGTNLAQLTNLPGATFSGGVSISDDGTKIAFALNGNLGDLDGDGTDDNPDFSYEVFTLLHDGTSLRQLTGGDTWDSVSPVISGDGTKVVYRSNDDPPGAIGAQGEKNDNHQNEIFVVDWDGVSNHYQLTRTTTNIQGAEKDAFSPWISDVDPDGSGHVIVYATTHTQGQFNTDGNVEVYRVRSDGAQLRPVTDTEFSDGAGLPIVSGDGSTVVVVSDDDLDGTLFGWDNDDISPELFAMDNPDPSLDGTYNVSAVQLTNGLFGIAEFPTMTPDATRIAFSSNADLLGLDPERNGEVYRLNGDGTGLGQVTNLFTGEIAGVALSANGQKIAFSSDADPDGSNSDLGFELFFVNWDGTGLDRVTDHFQKAKKVFHPVFNRSGTHVYFDWNADNGTDNSDANREIWRVNTTPPYTIDLLTDSVTGARNEKVRISDDNNFIVFHSTADFSVDGTLSVWQVWRASAVDGSGRALVCGDAMFEAYDCLEPDISSDGSTVVFSSNGDLVPGSNPEGNFEIFRYDVGTGTTTQLTATVRGRSVRPYLSGNDAWVYFLTNAPIFESDPDNPYHTARIHLATGAIERVGALANGLPTTPYPDDTGDVAVFASRGNHVLQNWDFADELFIVRHDIPAGGVDEIGISPGPAPTTVTVPQWVSGPMRYDFLRGNVADLQVLGGEVSLGAAVCVENDSLDLDTVGDEDLANPATGQAFFYLWRGDEGLNRVNSWGTSSAGLERNPQTGTGCLPN